MAVDVVIDDREPGAAGGPAAGTVSGRDARLASGLVGTFRAHPDVASVAVARLAAGDVHLRPAEGAEDDGAAGGAVDRADDERATVGIERKTPADYCSSAIGRTGSDLEDQVERLRAAVDHAYVLVEGTLSDLEGCRPGLSGSAVRGSLASITARLGVPVVPCGDRERLVDLAVRLVRKHTEAPGTRPVPAGSVTRSDVPVAVRMYACVEGVGPETATRLHEVYPTVADALAAGPDDLERVEGVGPVRARAIYDALHGGD